MVRGFEAAFVMVLVVSPGTSQTRMSQGAIASAQDAANKAFAAEMAREGKDCPNVNTTLEENECLKTAAETTRANFTAFYDNLKKLISLDPSSVAALDDSQKAWTAYRDKACGAIHEFFRDGTIAPSADMSCDIRLTRSRMRDLNAMYLPLH